MRKGQAIVVGRALRYFDKHQDLTSFQEAKLSLKRLKELLFGKPRPAETEAKDKSAKVLTVKK